MHATFSADIPASTDNLVACKVCGLVKTQRQFLERGCENCPYLEMRGDRQAVEDGTTGAFSGMVTVMDPATGWASKWMHLSTLAAGVYCLSVDEELPYEVKEMLENKDINHRIRNDDFYPPDNAFISALGQFFDHEFDLRMESTEEAEPIPVPLCDEKFDNSCFGNATIPFYRSGYVQNASGARQQINTVTSYLDGSVVYGSSEERALSLRTGVKGRMATSGGLLPDNILDLEMQGTPSYGKLKAAGDVRANVHPPMLALQTLFVREHNRLAAGLESENPNWSDEHIFQEARKLTVAYLQSICYYEYLPMLGISLPSYEGYDPAVDPSIDNFFAAVSYRYGHSEVSDVLFRVDEEGNEIADGHLLLSQAYFNPRASLNNGIEPLLRGMSMKIQAEVDTYFASSVRNYLFGTPMHGGKDLIAIDIQRGRDHGIPDYNTARIELGLPEVLSFEEITSDVYTRRILSELYDDDVNNLDAYVGGLAEDHVENTNVGALFYESLKDQYRRIRDGDRLFFENRDNGLFTEEQISEIKSTGLREIILRNSDIKFLPENIYLVENLEVHWPKGIEPAESTEDTDGSLTDSTETTMTLKGETVLTYWLEEDQVHFKLRAATSGWMALGVEGPSGGMIDADIIISRVQNDQGEVHDSWSTTFAEPGLDEASGGTSDVSLHEFSEQDGITEVHFSRPLDTGDAFDRVINKDQPTNMIFAWGTDDAISYHGIDKRGKAKITVSTPVDTGDGGSSPETQTPLGGSLSLAEGNYEVTWSLHRGSGGARRLQESSYDRVKFTVKLKGEGWLGLGIAGEAGGMTGADIVIASGDCLVDDYWSTSFVQPEKDVDLGGSRDLEDVTCTRDSGLTEVTFSKPINPQDSHDNAFVTNGGTNVIYAFDLSSSTLAYHGINRGSAVLETGDSESSSPDTPTSSSIPADAAGLVFGESQLGALTLLWAISDDEITVKMRTMDNVWVGIGLEPEDGGMVNADMYLGYNDGEMKVRDCWSPGYAQPSEDTIAGGSDSLLTGGGSFENGIYEYWFTRKLDTGDDKDKPIEDKLIQLVYAWGSTPTLSYHGPSQRALASINFARAEGATTVRDLSLTMIRSHGGIMVASWAVLGITGSCIARFGRSWKYWLKAHRLIQISTTVLALIGEVIGFSYTKGSFRTAHSITALCVVFVTFPQVSLGAAAMKKSSSVHYSKLHKGTGYFLVGLAMWQIWTGLLTLEIGTRLKRIFIAWVSAWFLGFHFSSMGVSTKEIESMLKSATLPGESKDKQNRRKNALGIKNPDAKDIPTNEKSISRRASVKSQLSGSRGSEMIELLIKGESSDETDSDSARFEIMLSLLRLNKSGFSGEHTAWGRSRTQSQYGGEAITSDEFLIAVQQGKLLTIINDVVYDLTDYIKEHPGGVKVLEDIIGIDGTEAFIEAHGDDRNVLRVLNGLHMGELQDEAGILDMQQEGDRKSFILPSATMLGQDELSEGEGSVKSDASSIASATEIEETQSLISFDQGLHTRQWRKFPIENIDHLSHDVLLLRIHIPSDEPLYFPVTSHLLIRGKDPQTDKNVVRCFTPLIPNQEEARNKLDLLMKCYKDGRMSGYIRDRQVGDELEMKGPIRGLAMEKGKWQRIGLIGGGSGITPLWQVIESVLLDPEDPTKICLVYQNRNEEDILLRDRIDAFAADHPERFKVVYILSKPSASWTGLRGRMNVEILAAVLPPATAPRSFIMVCGPPGMNTSLAGDVNADEDEDQQDEGLLYQLGYTKEMIHVFH
eukprot:g480.t1